jgi:hypothetical protein
MVVNAGRPRIADSDIFRLKLESDFRKVIQEDATRLDLGQAYLIRKVVERHCTLPTEQRDEIYHSGSITL